MNAELAQVPQPVEDVPREYRQSKQQTLAEYEMRLQFLSRGCIVHVGCKSIAFETVESAMAEVNEYVTNPWDSQQKWRKLLS